MKAARPDDHAPVEVERAAAVTRMTVVWERQAARLSKALGLKAMADVDLADAFDWETETAAVYAVLRAVMQRMAEVGAWNVLARWNPEADGWSPEMVEAWIAKAAQTNAGRWSTAVYEALGAAVASDPANATDRLRDALASNGLAVGLATAFIAESHSFGAYDAATKSGLKSKTWRVKSKNPRPSHAAQNGETVPIGDVFSNGLRWPGDHYGNASENAGCTCELDYSAEPTEGDTP